MILLVEEFAICRTLGGMGKTRSIRFCWVRCCCSVLARLQF